MCTQICVSYSQISIKFYFMSKIYSLKIYGLFSFNAQCCELAPGCSAAQTQKLYYLNA